MMQMTKGIESALVACGVLQDLANRWFSSTSRAGNLLIPFQAAAVCTINMISDISA